MKKELLLLALAGLLGSSQVMAEAEEHHDVVAEEHHEEEAAAEVEACDVSSDEQCDADGAEVRALQELLKEAGVLQMDGGNDDDHDGE